jgi:hypothetical protein
MLFNNLRPRITISLTLPGSMRNVGGQVKVALKMSHSVDFNFKDIVGSKTKEFERKPKETRREAKFTSMKQHFDTGIATLEQTSRQKQT